MRTDCPVIYQAERTIQSVHRIDIFSGNDDTHYRYRRDLVYLCFYSFRSWLWRCAPSYTIAWDGHECVDGFASGGIGRVYHELEHFGG